MVFDLFFFLNLSLLTFVFVHSLLLLVVMALTICTILQVCNKSL